jgi:hypothetical protein
MKTVFLVVLASLVVMPATAHAQSAAQGKWLEDKKEYPATMNLRVDEKDEISGTVTIGGRDFVVTGQSTAPDAVSLSWSTAFPPEGNEVQYSARGTIKGDVMTLAVEGLVVSTGTRSKESTTLKRVK